MSTQSETKAVGAATSGSVFKGAMLISGTMIGGGMLAMPVATAQAGFFPTLMVYGLSWFFMVLTGLLLFEVNLWLKGGSNLVSMAEETLGSWGKWATWALSLFLFYCLMTAYVIGVANFFATLMPSIFTGSVGLFAASLCFLPVLVKGTKLVGKLNMWLVGGLALSYLIFVVWGASFVQGEFLAESNWLLTTTAFPVAFTAFSYQGIVPTLTTYLDRDPQKMKRAIWLGTTVTLVTYIIWGILIMGIVPWEDLVGASSAVAPLKTWLDIPYIDFVAQSFAFFALFTSFLGVALGLIDFLADGFKIKKDKRGKIMLGLMVLVPPVLLNLFFGNLFITAIEYAGGIGCALLLGLMPTLMAWKGRKHNPDAAYRMRGGKALLSVMVLFFLFEVALELNHIF